MVLVVPSEFWMGLELSPTSPLTSACSNAACNGNPGVQWRDGSPFNEYGTVFRVSLNNKILVAKNYVKLSFS